MTINKNLQTRLSSSADSCCLENVPQLQLCWTVVPEFFVAAFSHDGVLNWLRNTGNINFSTMCTIRTYVLCILIVFRIHTYMQQDRYYTWPTICLVVVNDILSFCQENSEVQKYSLHNKIIVMYICIYLIAAAVENAKLGRVTLCSSVHDRLIQGCSQQFKVGKTHLETSSIASNHAQQTWKKCSS